MYKINAEARDKFLLGLEWMLAVTRRYPGALQFCLVLIKHNNYSLLGESYGAQMASRQLDEALQSLRQAFRKTDLVARDGSDFWIMVPFSPDNEKVSDKIKYILESLSLAGLHIVERDISFFSWPLSLKDIPLSDDAQPLEVLAYLKKNQTLLAHHKVILPASA